jgi:ribosomal protein L7/L12
MAKPIKETPILTGKEAADFLYAAKVAEQQKITKQEAERIKASFKRLSAIAKF